MLIFRFFALDSPNVNHFDIAFKPRKKMVNLGFIRPKIRVCSFFFLFKLKLKRALNYTDFFTAILGHSFSDVCSFFEKKTKQKN